MKKLLSRVLSIALVLSCVFLAGCSSTVYGKTYQYKGEINMCWSSLPKSYGDGIEEIITNQIKANNVDWTACKFGDEVVDLSAENFKNGKEVVEYFTNMYKEKINDKIKDIVITVGTEEEATLTATLGEEKLVYNLKKADNNDNLLNAYLVTNGVEEEMLSFSLNPTVYENNLLLIGASYDTTIVIAVKEALENEMGEQVNIEFSLAAYYSKI